MYQTAIEILSSPALRGAIIIGLWWLISATAIGMLVGHFIRTGSKASELPEIEPACHLFDKPTKSPILLFPEP